MPLKLENEDREIAALAEKVKAVEEFFSKDLDEVYKDPQHRGHFTALNTIREDAQIFRDPRFRDVIDAILKRAVTGEIKLDKSRTQALTLCMKRFPSAPPKPNEIRDARVIEIVDAGAE